jgi:hypothetical protein
MKIFLRGLPDELHPRNLETFVQTVITPPWYLPLRTRAAIKSCVVLKVKDLDRNAVEFHGLLEIRPVKVALMAIEQLNGTKLKGYRIEARKWQVRTNQNDRRDRYKRFKSDESDERRGYERRRPNLLVEIYVPPQFQGLAKFHRLHGS